MGCWSVSCGISNIAITSGNKCVLLPLKENRLHGYGYSSHIAAALPIFGQYNDYGGIEEIEKNENTALIEDHFGITIEEFCEFLVDGKFTYNRSEVNPIIKKLKKNESFKEIENWRFMWIDRKVYDFMKVSLDRHDKGHMDYGTPEMLTRFGFEKVEKAKIKNYDAKRFNQLWKKGDVELYSDGNTLLSKKDNYIFYFGKGSESSIETYFEVPEEFQYLKDKTEAEAWRVAKPGKAKSLIGGIIGCRYDFEDESLEEMLAKIRGEKLIPKTLQAKYLGNLEIFGDSLVEITNIYRNLHCMSGQFSPHVLYLTPQCGEYSEHQILLEKFAEINKSYTQNEEDYDS